MPSHQLSLTLIAHKVQDTVIDQRAGDGYINGTAMCKAAGKLMADYLRLGTTKDFLAELSADMGIPISDLIQVVKGGDPTAQGTWVHPNAALHLAQWLSAKFSVQVSKWVHDWMSGKLTPTKLPYHLERHMLNLHKIPSGYFSVLQEMTNFLVGPMEANGYRMREDMMPDISQAKMLCKHLRDQLGIDTSKLLKYIHTFPDGREVEANLYDLDHLAAFRRMMADKWMPDQAPGYFQKRDPNALPALDKILLLGTSAAPKLAASNKPKFNKKA